MRCFNKRVNIFFDAETLIMKDHELKDLFQLKNIGEVVQDSGNKKIAYTSSENYREYDRPTESSVVVLSLPSYKEETSLHEAGFTNKKPKFSTNAERLAYISKSEKVNYLVLYEVGNHRAEKLYLESPIIDFQWLEDNSIILLLKDTDSPEEKRKRDSGDDAYFFEENLKYDSLWHYVPGFGIKRITENLQIWDFSVNKGLICAITSRHPYEYSWYRSELTIINIRDGSIRKLYSPERGQMAIPILSPDNSKVAFTESLWSDRGASAGDLITVEVETGASKNYTENLEKSVVYFQWKDDSSLYALLNNMGTFELSVFDFKSFRNIWQKDGTVIPEFSPKFSYSNGKFAFSFENSDQPPEVMIVDEKTGLGEVISKENERLRDDLKHYSTEKISWKSRDGFEIYGLFRSAGDKKPLIVSVHGGPTASATEDFIGRTSIMVSRGYSVFVPNYRGSTGKGRKYAESNVGDMGGKDLEDIESGVEYLISKGLVDGKRVYIAGGSYGGFIAAWAASQTKLFKASAAFFGISDWISFHGTNDIPDWDRLAYDQDPYEFDKFVKFSPIRHLEETNTPLLLMHGLDDTNVPVGQFYQLYRGLRDKGKEVRLMLMPREGHGFKERKHVEAYTREMFNWFDKHK